MSNAPVTVVFHRLAAREFRQARDWYARRSQALSSQFVQAIDAVVQQIAAQPLAGALFQGRFRWRRPRRFPYVLYYDIVAPDQVMILASPTPADARATGAGGPRKCPFSPLSPRSARTGSS